MLPIYVDFDDVLSETGLSIINILKKEYGRDVAMEDLTSFDLKEAFGLTPSEYDHLFELIHSPHEVLAYKPVPGAVETLKAWADKGHEIAIMTGRFTSAYDASLEWLDRHEVPFDSFTVVDKYQRPGMDMGVAISMARLNTMQFSLAVEDSGVMARHLAREMNTRVALFDRPWNRELDCCPGISRCRRWNEIRELVP